MSIASTTQDQQEKTPFYLSEKKQDTPVGYLYLEEDTLVLEFRKPHPVVRIKRVKASTVVEFVDDSSICVNLPDNPGKKVRLFLRSDGEGRYAVYGIRKWSGIDGAEPRAARKMKYLARFDSFGAKLVVLWQLALPYLLFGTTFLLHAFVNESVSEVDYGVATWQWLALTPYVAVHYVILFIPAVVILFFNRLWGLRLMFLMSLMLVSIVAGCYFLPDALQFLPVSENPMIIPGYWLVFAPYMILLMLPSFYYIVVLRRF